MGFRDLLTLLACAATGTALCVGLAILLSGRPLKPFTWRRVPFGRLGVVSLVIWGVVYLGIGWAYFVTFDDPFRLGFPLFAGWAGTICAAGVFLGARVAGSRVHAGALYATIRLDSDDVASLHFVQGYRDWFTPVELAELIDRCVDSLPALRALGLTRLEITSPLLVNPVRQRDVLVAAQARFAGVALVAPRPLGGVMGTAYRWFYPDARRIALHRLCTSGIVIPL